MVEGNPQQELPVVVLLLDQLVLQHVLGIVGGQSIGPAEMGHRLPLSFFEQAMPSPVLVQLSRIVSVLAELLGNEDDVQVDHIYVDVSLQF